MVADHAAIPSTWFMRSKDFVEGLHALRELTDQRFVPVSALDEQGHAGPVANKVDPLAFRYPQATLALCDVFFWNLARQDHLHLKLQQLGLENLRTLIASPGFESLVSRQDSNESPAECGAFVFLGFE